MDKRTKKTKTIKRPSFYLARTEKPVLNKHSIAAMVAVVLVMTAITIYTGISVNEGKEWFLLSAVIIAAAGLFTLLRFRYSVLVEVLLAAVTPAAVFMLVESYTHLLSQMWEGPVFLNLVIYYLFFGFMVLIIGRTGPALIVSAGLLAVAGLANYFVILFRSSPILPWDLYSVGVAAAVADNFEYTLTIRACNVLLLFTLLAVICAKMRTGIRRRKIRAGGAVLLLAAMLAFGKGVQTDAAAEIFTMDTTLFTPKVLYRNNGLVLSFIVNMRYLNIEEPDGYSAETAQELQEEVSAENTPASATEEKPNIIVIMNEAFSDLSVLGDFETNVDVMPFIDSLSENTQKGWMYASVKGGNTANTEFEFLTGSTLYWLPVGSVAYQQYIRGELPSLSSQLDAIGYRTIAMHPYYSKGWNRNTVYGDMGFEEMYFINDFSSPEKLRSYVSDWTTYEKIISCYEDKSEDERLFVFDVTMQNHGSYVKRYDNFVPDVTIENGSGTYLAATEQYLSLIKRSDAAFSQLIRYFETQEEPTVILMFGDHQPADYVVSAIEDDREDTFENQQERYKVPYILWANYDIEETEGTSLSANYLAIELLEAAGLALTDYQYFLSELSERFPVITANMAVDAQGNYYERGDAFIADELYDYSVLQYNYIADVKHRLENFFSYREN